jgi:Uncharacterized conserved protein
MQDAWRAYLELALGLTEASRKRAQAAARKLVGSSGATAAQLQSMAEDLISTGMANREALIKTIRAEVDRTLGVLGLATTDEVAALAERVQRLEQELAAVRAAGAAPSPAEGGATAGAQPAGGGSAAYPESAGTPAEPAVQPKPAGRAAAKKAVAKKAAAGTAVVKKAAAGTAVAKKTVAKKAVAKKASAEKAVAKKTGGRKAAAVTRSAADGGAA